MADTKSILQRLNATLPTIQEIHNITQTPSITFGVVHRGQKIFTHAIGHRAPPSNAAPTADTIYMIGSVSKMFTAAAAGILVSEGKLSWADPVQKYIPEFNPKGDERIGREADIIDCMRHSTGLTAPDMLFLGPRGTILGDEEDVIHILNEMPTVDAQGNQRFNKEWAYNNYTVGLVALVIQRIAGQPFWEFIRERILAPLGMHRTAVTRAEISSDENIAPPYLTTTTGEFRRVSDSFWPCASHAPLLGATGMRSTLNDMLTFSIAILDAERAETDPNYTRQVPNNPLRQVTRMRRGYWTRPADDPDVTKDAAYGMGWFVAQIPGSMISAFSGNGFTREKEHRTHLEYILGDSENDRSHPIPVIAHTGGMRGALFSVFTFPQTQSAIVTMTNGRDFGDASDWTAQVLIQALFDLKPEVDLLPWVKKERGLHEGSYQKYVQGRWEENRRASEVERERGVYLGEYVGFNGHFSLSIVAAADSDDATGTNLSVVFNNRKESKRRLTFYKRDVYSTHQGDEDAWKISQLIAKDYKQFLLDFAVDDNGTCTGLRWMWNKDTEPAWFKKVE